MEPTVLYHHGVKGQKWGVRRSAEQLASAARKAGRTVAGARESARERRAKKIAADFDKGKRSGRRGKKLSVMSDEELQRQIKRLEMEQKYTALTSSKTENGKKFVNDVLKETGKDVVKQYTKKGMEKAIEKGIAKGAAAAARRR